MVDGANIGSAGGNVNDAGCFIPELHVATIEMVGRVLK
jgi:hypothetical protein